MAHEDFPSHWVISSGLDTINFPADDPGQKRIVGLLRKYSVEQILKDEIKEPVDLDLSKDSPDE